MSKLLAAATAEKPANAKGKRRAERLGVEERRQQLLQLGVKIVATRRYEEPWLEEVARSADISKGLIYHYFDTKRGFYVEILRHIAQGLAKNWSDLVTPLIEGGASADDVTDAGLASYLDYAQSYPTAFRTLVEAGGGIDPQVKQVETYLRDQIICHVAQFYGREDLSDLARAGVKGWAAFAQQVSFEWLDGGKLQRDDVVRLMRSQMRALFPATL